MIITATNSLIYFWNQNLNHLIGEIVILMIGNQQGNQLCMMMAKTDLVSIVNSSSILPRLLNQNNRLGVVFTGNYMK